MCDSSYLRVEANGSVTCELCPEGSVCSEPGSTLVNLTLMAGYWRESVNSSNIFRCPDALRDTGCRGGTGDPCKSSLTGVYCLVCVDAWAYYDSGDSVCKSCAMIPDESIIMMALGFLLVLAAIVQCALVARANRAELAAQAARKSAANRSPGQNQRMLALKELKGREEPDDDERMLRGLAACRSMDMISYRQDGADSARSGSSSKQATRYRSRHDASGSGGTGIARVLRKLHSVFLHAGLSYKIRLLISFLQVTCSLDEVYLLSFPTELVHFMQQIEVSTRPRRTPSVLTRPVTGRECMGIPPIPLP